MIGILIAKDLLRKARKPLGFLLLVGLPLGFAILLGLLFGLRKGGGGPQPRVRLLIEDLDRSFVSRLFVGAFGQGQLRELFLVTEVDSGQGMRWMDKGKGSALLILPKGFAQALYEERPIELHLVKNPSEVFAPRIAEETVSTLAGGVERLIRLLAGPLQTVRRYVDSGWDMTTAEVAGLSVQAYLLVRKVHDLFSPPALAIREVRVGGDETATSSQAFYFYFLSGISIFCLLFLLDSLSHDFFVERETRTQQRQLAILPSVRVYVLAKLLFLIGVGLIAHTLMWATAVPLFGIRVPWSQWLIFAGLSPLLLASLTGVVGVVAGIAKNQKAARVLSPVLILYFGMVGGVMIPLDNLPSSIRPLSVTSPIYWGQEAIRLLFIETASLHALGRHFAVLAATAVLGFITSMILIQRRIRG